VALVCNTDPTYNSLQSFFSNEKCYTIHVGNAVGNVIFNEKAEKQNRGNEKCRNKQRSYGTLFGSKDGERKM
jgi:hypothetical protein